MSIPHWPQGERPREKLLQKGADALSDAELLAIFLRTGIKGKSAVDLARDLLQEFGSLTALLNAPFKIATQFLGLGPSKYAQLQAGLALGQRYLHQQLSEGDVLSSSQATIDYLTSKLRHLPHEVFVCLCLNNQNQLLNYAEISSGTHNEARVYPREVVKHVLAHNASAVVFAHNHPSGSCQASEADIALTRVLQDALALVDVSVYDHIIIGAKTVFSFAERGWL
jgi:DNA repair protein RadC